MPSLEKLKNVMKNLKSGQPDTSFLPAVDRCMDCVDWLHQLHWLFNVDCCERIRKEAFLASFKLLSLQLPGGANENHKYLSQASSFPAEISAGLPPCYKSKCYD